MRLSRTHAPWTRGPVLGIAALASLVLVGCGDAAPEATEESGAAPSASTSAPEDSASSSESAPATSEAAGGSTVLVGTVGTDEDPEAFEIALTDEAGEPVTELPAGDYTIQVSDPSSIHNFRLMGGAVDEATSVPEMEETTFEVTLEAGEYTYVCDPHPGMTGSFTVT